MWLGLRLAFHLDTPALRWQNLIQWSMGHVRPADTNKIWTMIQWYRSTDKLAGFLPWQPLKIGAAPGRKMDGVPECWKMNEGMEQWNSGQQCSRRTAACSIRKTSKCYSFQIPYSVGARMDKWGCGMTMSQHWPWGGMSNDALFRTHAKMLQEESRLTKSSLRITVSSICVRSITNNIHPTWIKILQSEVTTSI